VFHFYNLSLKEKNTHTERKKKKPNNNSKTPTPPPSYTKKYCGGVWGVVVSVFLSFLSFLFPMLWWGVKTKLLNRAVFHVGDLTLLK
jgi:hypothetical protein